MDYPDLPDELFIFWSGNDRKWPDGGRETKYLSGEQSDIMRGYALFTPVAKGAKTFATQAEAKAWLKEQEAKRPHPYGVRITTVRAMKWERGYLAGTDIEHAINRAMDDLESAVDAAEAEGFGKCDAVDVVRIAAPFAERASQEAGCEIVARYSHENGVTFAPR